MTADKDETALWMPGKYAYQIQDENGIFEAGDFFVLRNFALQDATTYQSIWERAIKQIDDLLAGRATSASKTITVGDKTINYSSIEDLLKLRDYFSQRLAEEQAEETGVEQFSKNDQKKIIYRWRAQ